MPKSMREIIQDLMHTEEKRIEQERQLLSRPTKISLETKQFSRPSGYLTGYERAKGEAAYRLQRHHNPLGLALFILGVYLSFVIFAGLPLFNLWIVGWVFFFIWALAARSTGWVYLLIIFGVVTPLFGLGGGFVQDILSTGQVWSDSIRERISINLNFLDLRRNIYDTYDISKNPNIAEQEPKKGIQVLSFGTKDIFKEEKPVQIDAKVQIDGFYDSLTGSYEEQQVSFSCYEEDRQGKRFQEGEIYINDERLSSVTVDEATSIHYVSCRFPQGMKIQTTDTPVVGSIFGVEEGTEIGNKIVTKKRVVFEAHTRMLQITGLKLWTVAKANAPEDITEVANDPTLESDGRSKPQCRRGCGGPYFVTLTTGIMPMTETKSPRFMIAFVKNEQRFGTLERLNSMRLLFPEALSLELGKDAQGEPTSCDFSTGSMMSGDLLSDRLKAANQKISALVNFTSDDAPSLSLDFSCGYHVGNPLDKLGFHEVSVRADYDAVIRKRGLVEIYRDKPFSEEEMNIG